MRGGDISNEITMRVLVGLDCVLTKGVKVEKVLGISIPKEDVNYNRQALAQFWRWRENNDYSLELVGFGYSQKEMDEILDDLDNLGTNPFNYSKAYHVVADLVAELPYRPEVKYVIDVQDHAMRYGHWFLEEGAIYGSKQ
jgi:hypothetical protein